MSVVLVVGSGGREHALAWKLAKSAHVTKVIVSPGNDGFDQSWERWPLESFEKLAARARSEKVSLAVIGPDNPLAEGIVDVFEKAGIPAFGPSAAAAKIEASKVFAKEVMTSAGVPTARYFYARTIEEADEFLAAAAWPSGGGWVVKADGLALGKGVHVCGNLAEAREALSKTGAPVVIEERLKGVEISWMAFCDGRNCALLDPARDYKRLKDGDEGPNTGGMGAMSPVAGVPENFEARLREEVFLPVLREMEKRGCPFRGLLYAGLMLDGDKYWVLEFNARFGDPETQVLLPRMQDDLYKWCLASALGAQGELGTRVGFSREHAVVVVGASAGYPEAPIKGEVIHGSMENTDAPAYFVAGVRSSSSGLVTAGGRVFGAVGMGSTLALARAQAYERVSRVSFAGMQTRGDIAVGEKRGGA